MKIKVYGFKFDKAKLPKAMKAVDLFDRMSAAAGSKLGIRYRYGAKLVSVGEGEAAVQWWGGMILKVRDSSAFTKLTEKDGKTILSAETLADNEKLVELTYFVAHPETGSGLLAHHYHGTSLMAFAGVCQRVFSQLQKASRATALADKTTAEKKKIAKEFKGVLELQQLCNDTDLKSLVKQLKRVSSFELTLATLETKEKFLQGVSEKASNEIIKFTFPPETDIDGLADDAEELSKQDEVAAIKVVGYDSKKNRREYLNDQNPLVFHEADYDKAMKGLVLDLNEWGKSISDSAMVQKLIAVASGKSTLHLLKNA
jgi:hypothetical protein